MPWMNYFPFHNCTYPELCWMFGPTCSQNGLTDGTFHSFLNSGCNVNFKKYIDDQNIEDQFQFTEI